MGIINSIFRNLREIPGWHTRRKLLVIESDDWGAVRMPSKAVYNTLARAGLDVESDPFARYDSLATSDDLAALFEVLSSVKDKNGRPTLITANTVVANPDFEKIKSDNFLRYHFETFTETLKRYAACSDSFTLWKQGIGAGLFHPQYHGREHLNVAQWMQLLQSGHKEALLAFDQGVYGINFRNNGSKRANYMAAFDYETEEQKQEVYKIAAQGAQMFREAFGYTSGSFIAPSYVWDSGIEDRMQQAGVHTLQGITTQSIPSIGASAYISKYHYIGQINKNKQHYLVRNCFFEPSIKPDFDWAGDCMKRIAMIFKWGRPVIMGSHRLNFIGSIQEENRNKNLVVFKALLSSIVKRWPDVEFISSDELGLMMKK